MSRVVIALQVVVWLMNGLYCKVLRMVPRHEAIVARIFGSEHAPALTQLIGLSEILLAIWITSGIRARLTIFVQIMLVALMNVIEAVFSPDLLLFGYGNAVVALTFIAFLAYSLRLNPAASASENMTA